MTLDSYTQSIWKRKRERTYYVYLFQSVFIGFELTIVQATLLEYLQRSVPVKQHVKLYYDITNAIVYVCPVVFGSLVGRWMDRTRNVRGTLIALNVLVFVGTFVYMIPFSPVLIVIGRFLHGFHFIIRSIVYSEFTRIFSEAEVHQKIPAFLTGLSIGYCMGPLTNMLFLRVDFWLGAVHMTYGNASSIPLLLLSVVQISLLVFCSHNISMEYDLKGDETQVQRMLSDDNQTEKQPEKQTLLQHIKDIMCVEYMLLLFMSSLL